MRSVALVLVALVVLQGAQANPAMSAGVATLDSLMGPPMEKLLARSPEGAATSNVEAAIGQHAYRSALIYLIEATASIQADEAWEQAQSAESPADDYIANLTISFNQASNLMVELSRELDAKTAEGLTGGRMDVLLLAARFLVEAESERWAAQRYLLATQELSSFQNQVFRYTLARPVIAAIVLATVSSSLLEALPEAQGGTVVQPGRIAELIALGGGTPGAWIIPEGGILHRLARHVWDFMQVSSNATLADIDQSQAKALEAYNLAGRIGSEGVVPAAASLDAQWWLARFSADESNPVDAPLRRTLNATLMGSYYQTMILRESSLVKSDWLDSWPWWGSGTALVALAGLGSWMWRRKPQ